MHFVVAYDGTPISRTALARAETLAAGVDGKVKAVTVLPDGNARYARERGWLDESEPWDEAAILETLAESVAAVAPDATFESHRVDKYAPRGAIGRALKKTAERDGVDVLAIGSENAGRVLTALTTVTRSVGSGTYDVLLVRETDTDRR